MSTAVSKSNAPLLDEAERFVKEAALRELRRKIAAASAEGVVASPALLSEFARTQKACFDHRIEIEKRRRLGEVPVPELPITPFPVEGPTTTIAATPEIQQKPDLASSVVPTQSPYVTARELAAHLMLLTLMIVIASAAAWAWSNRAGWVR